MRCIVTAAVCMGWLTVMGGCQSAGPRGDTGGRIDPYETTPDDHKSPYVNPADLIEFSDRTAEALAGDLGDLPEFKNRRTRAVLAIGDMRNLTSVPSSEFEMLAIRTRDQLVGLRQVTDNVKIVEDRGRLERLAERETGVQADVLEEGRSASGVSRYNPDDVYVLLGDFYQSNRRDAKRYYFTFSVTHLGSREIIFKQNYDLGQY